MCFYRVRKRAYLLCFTVVVAALVFSVSSSTASQYGRTGFSGNPQTSGGSTCIACHAANGLEPTVQLSGPATVDTGSTHLYTVTLTGGPAVTGGLNVSTKDLAGSLAAIDSDLSLLDGELAHTMPKPFAGDTLQFNFEWTAPAYTHESVIYVAGNSSNGQLDLVGDGIGTTSLAIAVQNGTDEQPSSSQPVQTNIELTRFAEGLNSPVSVAHAGDDRLFAAELLGRIRVIEADGTVLSTPFLDIEARVNDREPEQGLLGLAFHPNYAANGYFFVNYTVEVNEEPTDRTRISRFTVTDDPNLADANSEVVIMEFEQWTDNHNGGDIAFGSDGYLYIASGDGGGGGDTENNSQNPSTPLGAILRIDVDMRDGAQNRPDCDLSATRNYSIPSTNAYVDGVGGAGCDEIFAMGLRNPWRMSFDRATGDLWIGDVGQYGREEINRIQNGQAGWNLGWRCYEGNLEYNTNGCADRDEYVFPVYDYGRDDGCSVTGGYVYRGTQNPSLWGTYFFSDFCNPEIRALSFVADTYTHAVVHDGSYIYNIAAFGEDVHGELYVVSTGEGALYRISEIAPPRPTVADLLVFHRTTGFRHNSIEAGLEMIERFGEANGWSVDESQRAGDINAANLARYDSVIFLNATGGDLLNDEQVDALLSYVQAGGGFVGVHGAADALYTNAQYEALMGVLIDESNKHSPNNTQVDLDVKPHPVNASLPNPLGFADELYNFNFQPPTTYLLTVDEATYDGDNGIGGANHALAWVKGEGDGCVFYSSLGHDSHLYSGNDEMDLWFQTHIENGIKWSMDCQPLPTPTPAPTETPTSVPTMVATSTPTLMATATNMPDVTATPTPIPLTVTPVLTLLATSAATSAPTFQPTPQPTAAVTVDPADTAPPLVTQSVPTAITPTETTIPTDTPTPIAPSGPTAAFVSIDDGATLPPGTDLYVRVDVDNADNAPLSAQLFLNGELVRQENVVPYEWGSSKQNDEALASMQAGNYELKVVISGAGRLSITETIQFSVGLIVWPRPTPLPTLMPSATITTPYGTNTDYSIFLSLMEWGAPETE